MIASSAQDNAYLINNSVPLTIYTTVGFFLGLAAIFGVLYQPRRAFRSCGRHKWRWILIEIVGTLLNAGVFVWFIWRFFIRKSVIRARRTTLRRFVVCMMTSVRMRGWSSGLSMTMMSR